MWSWKRKSPATQLKSTSFLLGMGAYRAALSGAGYDLLSKEGYTENVIVNACVNKIASAIASIDPKLYQKVNGKLKQVETHPLLDLLENPNPTQSGKEFIRYLVSYYLLAGNAYVFGNGVNPQSIKSKPPTELMILNPGKMKVIEGEALFPKQFEYKPDPQKPAIVYEVDKMSGLSAVMQFKTFNPVNQWYGLPPMLAAAFGIDIFNSGQKYNKRLLDNDARPSGALTVKDADGKAATLSEDQYQRLKEMIDSQMSGPNNAGKPLLLEGGLEWQSLSLNARDLDFLKGKDSAARDIGLVFGVPSQLLQIPGDSTFANYEQATLSFWTDTVIPLLCWFLEGFNRWLTPLYGDDLYLWYDEEQIAALEPRRKEKFARIQSAESMTINEKRRALGMDDFPGDMGNALLLSGRGVLLGEDGSIVALGITNNVDANQDPLAGGTAPAQPDQKKPDPAKHRAWLESLGYTKEKAERLTKLTYGA